VLAEMAEMAGIFIDRARIPGVRPLRAFQGAEGAAALEWLRTRTGWR
jgi:hypothetical protein